MGDCQRFNASANDAMIESLADIMLDFDGEPNRARCLAHIINLVVKIILRQFDIPKKKPKKDLPATNDLESNGPDMASGNDHNVMRLRKSLRN